MIHRIEFRAMGCQMSAALDSPGARGAQVLARLPAWFDEWESCLSRFRPESELSLLNRSAGEWVQVSRTLWDVFRAALDANRRSGGLVNPLVLNALASAGYDRSWEAVGQAGDMPPDRLLVPVPVVEAIQWEAAARAIRLPADVRIDFGGVAKGWAAHQAMLRLRHRGPALVDAGGDIAISGLQSGGRPWPVGIIDPFHPEADLALLGLGRCGVATSGRDFRRWRQGETWRHHLIDPRSSLPSGTDILSATVVGPNVMEAEMAAKTVLILGSRAGLDWLEARPALAGLLVLEDGTRRDSQRMEAHLWR